MSFSRLACPDPPNNELIWVQDHYSRYEWTLQKRNPDDDSSQSPNIVERNEDEVHHIIEHIVLPSDTFPGICLSYRISATKLRQTNRFSGTNLALAPRKLFIPISRRNRAWIKRQNHDCNEFKIYCLLAEVPLLSKRDAKAYLFMTDFDLCKAIGEATSDLQWEEESSVMFVRAGMHIPKVLTNADVASTETVQKNQNKTDSLNAQSQHEKKGHEETWVEMKTMTTNRPNKGCLTFASSSNDDQRQPLEYPLFLSRMSQAISAEDTLQAHIKTALLDSGLSLNKLWLQLISNFHPADVSHCFAEYEMNELQHNLTNKFKIH